MAEISPNVLISMPTQPFTMARSFKACANGKIYIGKPDTDPMLPVNQIQVYIEREDGAYIPVPQPINISAAGLPVYLGQIAKFVTTQAHSMIVNDAYGAQQFYYTNVIKYDASQVVQVLGSFDGLKMIGQYPDVQSLRSAYNLVSGQQVFVSEHTAGLGFGGGVFYVHSITSDGFVDDNGYQIISSSGLVFRRKGVSELNSRMFGLSSGGNINDCLENMYKASRNASIYRVKVMDPPVDGGYYVGTRNSRFYIGDFPFHVIGHDEGFYGPLIYHAFNGVLFTFSRFKASGEAKNFWTSGGIKGFRFEGKSNDLSGLNTGDIATPVRLSDAWKMYAKDLFITGYTGNSSGAVVSVYNEFAWTEGCDISNIMVRASLRGVRFHRNTATGSTATDSFFRSNVDIDFNAGVSGSLCGVIISGDGTKAGECFVYGYDIKVTFWTAAGAFHHVVWATSYSNFSVDGLFTMRADGYGISKSVVPSTEVMHLFRVDDETASIQGRTNLISNQNGSWGIDFVNIISRSVMYSPAAILYTTTDGSCPLSVQGAKMVFRGVITAAQHIAGKVVTFNSIPNGIAYAITINTWRSNDRFAQVCRRYICTSEGKDYLMRVVESNPVIGQTNTSAVANTPSGTDTFLKTVNPVITSGTDAATLRLFNASNTASSGYSVNNGNILRFVVDALSSATNDIPYTITIEVL